MRRVTRILAYIALIVFSVSILSGCLLRTMYGGVGALPGRGLTVSFYTDQNVVTCWRIDYDDGTFGHNCTYWLIDEEGFLFFTSTADLIAELGFLGIVVDPLILQVPNDAHNATGTFQYFDGQEWVGPDTLIITMTDSFAADASTRVNAEPGHTFLIVELPDYALALIPEGTDPATRDPFTDSPLVNGIHFFFEFEFDLVTPRSIDVKPMATIRVDVNDETFYAPMTPCVTDFADVPAITLPYGFTVDLFPQLRAAFTEAVAAGTHACDRAVYNFEPGDGPPPPPPPPGEEVDIDVMPGSDENPINPRSRGVIPVAILSTSDFDAASVDPGTLRFGPGGATVAIGQGNLEDVDGDGLLDLVVHFRTQETGLACDDDEVTLRGSTFDGIDFEATDAIKTVGCR
jgi:hypothetical protein